MSDVEVIKAKIEVDADQWNAYVENLKKAREEAESKLPAALRKSLAQGAKLRKDASEYANALKEQMSIRNKIGNLISKQIGEEHKFTTAVIQTAVAMGKVKDLMFATVGGARSVTWQMIKWGSLIGSLGGLGGVGIAYTVSRLASNLANQEQNARQLGTTSGRLKAGKYLYQPLLGEGGFEQVTSHIANIRYSPGEAARLGGMFQIPTDKIRNDDSSETARLLIDKLYEEVRNNPEAAHAKQMAEMLGLDNRVINTLRGKNAPEELEYANRKFSSESKRLELSAREKEAGMKAAQSMEQIAERMANVRDRIVVALAPSIASLGDSLVKITEDWIRSGQAKKMFDSIAASFNKVAKWADGSGKDAIENFVDVLTTAAGGIAAVVEYAMDLFGLRLKSKEEKAADKAFKDPYGDKGFTIGDAKKLGVPYKEAADVVDFYYTGANRKDDGIVKQSPQALNRIESAAGASAALQLVRGQNMYVGETADKALMSEFIAAVKRLGEIAEQPVEVRVHATSDGRLMVDSITPRTFSSMATGRR